MKLTMEIEWHNLLENPDDLPKSDELCLVAFLKNGKLCFEFDPWCYIEEEKCFYHDDYTCGHIRYYSDELLDACGQIVAWACWPSHSDTIIALSKEILGKEAAKND